MTRDAQLTPRRKEALICAAQGLSIKATAVRMGISSDTVGVHRLAAYKALGLKNSADAARYALAKGWIENEFCDA